jgi:ribosomal protein S18 acetylase RimI-like enzyme
VRLRFAGGADAEAIARIHIASWRAAYSHALPAQYLAALDQKERTQLWQSRLATPATRVLILENESGIAAFCACGPARDDDARGHHIWEIYNLHVSPELRGHGLGGILFDAALELGRAQKAEQLTLWVVESNQPARGFYEKKQMKHDGGRKQHDLSDGAALGEIRYRLPLLV